jgi:pyoverdine/dityrosine biosynthesis protein Dit1
LLTDRTDDTLVAEPEEVKSQPISPIQVKAQLPRILASHDIAHRILDVLQAYGRHIEPEGDGNHKWLGREKFLPRVEEHVRNQQTVKMILPSFPWKSVNRVDKVTGALPDLGEELAFARLNALCVDIGKVYEHGAEVHIATDGLVFNGMDFLIRTCIC